MGELKSALRATFEQFQAFRDERPKEEKWELIDGVMTMMPPPSMTHQRIAKNLGVLLHLHLSRVRPEWEADHEIGLLLPADDSYNPEPDIIVVDRDYRAGQIYAERFYFVAEVLSPNDKMWVLQLKRNYYQSHEHCRGVLFVHQDRIAAELMVRDGADWQLQTLESAADAMIVPDIGDIGTLGALYRHTPLQPTA